MVVPLNSVPDYDCPAGVPKDYLFILLCYAKRFNYSSGKQPEICHIMGGGTRGLGGALVPIPHCFAEKDSTHFTKYSKYRIRRDKDNRIKNIFIDKLRKVLLH